jgi:hypothetical protein
MLIQLLTLTLCSLARAQTCTNTLPYSNMRYLTAAELLRYNVADPCTVACSTGFYGEFCAPVPAPPPVGPWNQAGYYTSGPGLVRGLTLNTGLLYQAQAAGDALVGLTAIATSAAQVVLVSLSTRLSTTILSAPSPGSLDALVMRGGVAYVARTLQSGFDVVGMAPQAGAVPSRLVSITNKAAFIEVFVDKGTVTVFVAMRNNVISACYPTGCVQLKSVSGVTGLFCGPDCPHSVYYAYSTILMRLSGVQGTVSEAEVTRDTANILCLGGDKSLNALLFLSAAGLRQVNLGGGPVLTPASIVGQTFCSLDISDSYSQIMVAQSGSVISIIAYQQLCGYGKTSAAVYSNASACVPCPAPPDNAFYTFGSAVCEWRCSAGYVQAGGVCALPVVQPCPDYFRSAADGLCVPGVQPWATANAYVSALRQTGGVFGIQSINPYLLASNGTGLFLVAGGVFYYASSQFSFQTLSVTQVTTGSACARSAGNSYNMLAVQGQTVLAGLYTVSAGQQTHCLWALNAGRTSMTQVRAWSLAAPVCAAATRDLDTVYVIYCNSHYVAQLSKASVPSPLAGRSSPGYLDGPLLQSAFNGPSGLVLFESRLYLADQSNCVLREVDLLRGVVRTVAGGVCQRSDTGGLAYPSNLTYSAYPGFFLFLDQYPGEAFPTLRQFHAPTGTLATVATAAVPRNWLTFVVGLGDRLLIGFSKNYFEIAALTVACASGFAAGPGGAYSALDCVGCQYGYYSGPAGCTACSSPGCGGAGQLVVPCQAAQDAYCGSCSNKPTGSNYTGPSSVPGTADGGGDCPWAYLPPCPVGYYLNGTLCAACPMWSSTTAVGATSLSQCVCRSGTGRDGKCTIPSPFAAQPSVCGPLQSCPYTEPAFPFPLLDSCPYLVTDSPLQVCPCSPGQYVQQIHPKVCAPCPQGLYSALGRGCRNCPYFTEPTPDRAGCLCALGAWDAALSTSSPQCMCGPGHRLADGCVPCPENTYSAAIVPVGSALQCTACEAGKAAPAGASQCVPCALGQYRVGAGACVACDAGSYAPDASKAVCVRCVADCGGRRESACPTDAGLVMCSDCGPARANSRLNGGLDCATDCLDGFYELDGECVPCSVVACGAGARRVACSRYADAACVACVNSSMPANFAVWAADCSWRCADGYSLAPPALPGVSSAWQCLEANKWTVWDLFTV